MDYYQMQITFADSELRNGIAKAAAPTGESVKPLVGKK